MALIPTNAKKIKIQFVCDVCGVDTIVESVDVPESGQVVVEAVCPVCFKAFEVVIENRSVTTTHFDGDIEVTAV